MRSSVRNISSNAPRSKLDGIIDDAGARSAGTHPRLALHDRSATDDDRRGRLIADVDLKEAAAVSRDRKPRADANREVRRDRPVDGIERLALEKRACSERRAMTVQSANRRRRTRTSDRTMNMDKASRRMGWPECKPHAARNTLYKNGLAVPLITGLPAGLRF